MQEELMCIGSATQAIYVLPLFCYIQRTFAVHVSVTVRCIPRGRWGKRESHHLWELEVHLWVCYLVKYVKTDSIFIFAYVTAFILISIFLWKDPKQLVFIWLVIHLQKVSPIAPHAMWADIKGIVYNIFTPRSHISLG